MWFGPNVQIEKEGKKEGGGSFVKKVGHILYKIYFETLSSQDQEADLGGGGGGAGRGVRSMQIVHGYLGNPSSDWKRRDHKAGEKFKESD